MDSMPLWLAAFALGFVHSFDIDHLCAVASFTSRTRQPGDGLRLGLHWACGHSLAVMVFGTLLVVLKTSLPARVDTLAEFIVGLALVVVGAWLIRQGFRQRHLHVHWHEHDGQAHFHVHSHEHGAHHLHEHQLTLLGVLHGLAGTSGVMVLIPVSLAGSAAAALGYVFVFGLGTVISMALFGAFAGRVFAWFSGWQRATRWLRGTVGFTSCSVGIWWLVRSLRLMHP